MRKPTGKQLRDASGVVVGVASKAANGGGSVYFDASKGRYRATFIDPEGRRRTILGKTQAEALSRRDAKVDEMAAPPTSALGPSPTVRDLVEWWLTHCADVRPSTMASYTNQGRLINDRLGKVQLADLGVEQVRLFLTDMRGEFAPDTVRNVRARLRQVLEEGVVLGHLSTNPVTRVKAPRSVVSSTRKPKRTLTAADCRRLVEAAEGHRLGAAVALLFLMGNRSSEVLGLAWSDVDLDAATAVVRRGSTFVGGGVGQTLDDPKTVSTAGVHHLPPTVVRLLGHRRQVQAVEMLEARAAWQTTIYRGSNLDMVFTNASGRLVLSQALYKAVRDVCALAEVDPVGVGTHTGRRSVVTALYGAGLQLEDVARHVGHASPKTTAGYVGDLGRRPEATAAIAAHLLDPSAD